MKRAHPDTQTQVEKVLADPLLKQIFVETVEEAESSYARQNGTKPIDVLELGGAGGITASIRPGWTVSDVREAPGVTVICSADETPFEDQSFDMVFAQDVLHHLPNLPKFATELHRILRPNGIAFFREPYWGPLAQAVWRFAHPEDFSVKRLQLEQKFDAPMEGNQALAQAIILNKRADITAVFRDFSVVAGGPRLGLAFALSGGSTFTSKIPRSLLIPMHDLERRLHFLRSLTGFAYTFTLIPR